MRMITEKLSNRTTLVLLMLFVALAVTLLSLNGWQTARYTAPVEPPSVPGRPLTAEENEELDTLLIEAHRAGASAEEIKQLLVNFKTQRTGAPYQGTVQVGGAPATPERSLHYYLWRGLISGSA